MLNSCIPRFNRMYSIKPCSAIYFHLSGVVVFRLLKVRFNLKEERIVHTVFFPIEPPGGKAMVGVIVIEI